MKKLEGYIQIKTCRNSEKNKSRTFLWNDTGRIGNKKSREDLINLLTNIIGGGYTDRWRDIDIRGETDGYASKQGELMRLFLFFKNKECRLKIVIVSYIFQNAEDTTDVNIKTNK
jgi:hypothetical protein